MKKYLVAALLIGFTSVNCLAHNTTIEACDVSELKEISNCSLIGNLAYPSYNDGVLKFYAAYMETHHLFEVSSQSNSTRLDVLANLINKEKIDKIVIDRKRFISTKVNETYRETALDISEITTQLKK
jgi:hypothetical protein